MDDGEPVCDEQCYYSKNINDVPGCDMSSFGEPCVPGLRAQRDEAKKSAELWESEWRKSEDNMQSVANGTACVTCTYRSIAESIAPTLNQLRESLVKEPPR
jgi:hypothetical protein